MIKPAVLILTKEGEVIADDRATGTKYIRKDRIAELEQQLAELRGLQDKLEEVYPVVAAHIKRLLAHIE